MSPVATTVRSTTGTAPLTFDRVSPDKIQITDEYGATQLYYVKDLLAACKAETEQEPTP